MGATLIRTVVFLALVYPAQSQTTYSAQAEKSNHYNVCPAGNIYNGQELMTTKGRSSVHCSVLCPKTAGCKAFNFCPDDLSIAAGACTLLGDSSPAGCDGLSPATSPRCRYGEMRQEPQPCANGGTWNGTYCFCPFEFTGKTCIRRIRDCTEAYENGYGFEHYGVHLIQPDTSPSPFPVYCLEDYTYALLRWPPPAFPSLNWTTARSGVGINSSTIPDLYNFFIGLDNLHRLLQQSTYQTNILFEFNSRTATSVNCYYDFKVGSETTAYSLTYAYYAPSFGPADEGFSLANPVIFSTSDNDPNGCVASKGAPGWYGADCVGPALFREDGMMWPMGGVDVDNIDLLRMTSVRRGTLTDP